MKRLLEGCEDIIQNLPENIIWCYDMDQTLYHGMQETIPNITFIEGVPNDLEATLDPSVGNLIVLDDMKHQLSRNPRVTDLFTKGSHHLNLLVIFIVQNLFHKGKELRGISLNCHYLVIFKSPRDNSQIIHLAKQTNPGSVKYVLKRFRMRPQSFMGTFYMISNRKQWTILEFDLVYFPESNKWLMLRSNKIQKTLYNNNNNNNNTNNNNNNNNNNNDNNNNNNNNL